jgi:hypothetical protein
MSQKDDIFDLSGRHAVVTGAGGAQEERSAGLWLWALLAAARRWC